ncbi:hypothetical protein ACFL5H_03545 [Candidatus Latescibacterota bacterium]
MQLVTLSLALIGTILIIKLGPLKGLMVYFIGLCWYPQPLVIDIATVEFSLSRILMFPLMLSILSRSKLISGLKWNLLDTLVIAYVIGKIIAVSQNEPLMAFIVREGAGFIDSILPYFMARIIITTKEKLLFFIKSLVIIGIPLSIMGVYQSITGNNPFIFFSQYYGWGFAGHEVSLMRHGFYRANVNFLVAISFGLFLAGIAVLCLGLWYKQVWSRKRIILCFVLLLLGVYSSMSSAPYFSIMVSILVLTCFPLKRYRVPILFMVVVSIVFLEYYSNRHWYEVFDRLAYSGETAYYRVGLINEAFGGGMDGYWIQGYGYVGGGPGSDNTNFNWVHKDLVNIYINILARYGLLGLFPFLGINFLYYKRLYLACSIIRTNADLWLIWCILSTLVGWNVALLTVSPMDQVNTLLFVIIGISTNLPSIIVSSNDN